MALYRLTHQSHERYVVLPERGVPHVHTINCPWSPKWGMHWLKVLLPQGTWYCSHCTLWGKAERLEETAILALYPEVAAAAEEAEACT